MQIVYLRDERDPLCMSSLGGEAYNKLNNEVKRLKSDVHVGRIHMLP